ncbi:MAG: hypothetical protein OEM49_09145 [Myxococcales bacterium]|nr:hypothetical protein [Myxococcales bacterium]MDH5305958.1 hypothetical protein [Myxococcales bacterium]MDH5567355.1 hypothetical protein [Myxococcales bacterium]
MSDKDRKIGLWIDHRKAVLVTLDDGGVAIETLKSDVEPRVRTTGGSRSRTVYHAQEVVSESQRDRRVQQQIRRYFDSVLDHLHGASAIFVMGPGEARGEFAQLLGSSTRYRDIPTQVAAADKLSDRQIAAKVKEYFGIATRPD